jgi:enterochelin esterase-like enzyme
MKMKNKMVFTAIILLLLINNLGNVFAQSGQVMERLSFKSKILGTDVFYTIYLPHDYQSSARRYPVVYLLHGYTDDDSGWLQFGEVNHIADKGIASGEIPPMIIVMPDAGVSWYINDYKGKVRFEDMFIQELIPYIDATYRTRAKKEFRAVSGLSMGGYGSLVLSMRNPDVFAACAAFSSAVRSDEEVVNTPKEWHDRVFGPLFGENLEGSARLTAHWKKYSILEIVKNTPKEQLSKVRYYIDSGDDDFLYEGNNLLHIALRKKEVPNEYRVHDGAHNWTYWRTYLIEGLKFIGQSFHR